MALQYVQHKDIDQSKWDLAIGKSHNPQIYAESWYLNITTGNKWDAIITDDYSAIMPLPYNNKLFGVAQIYQPLFTQQLGVIHSDARVDCDSFFAAIPQKFKRLHYPFNHHNSVEDCSLKTNLILPLDNDYETLTRGFSSSLRKRIKRAQDVEFSESTDVQAVVDFYKLHLEEKVKLGDKAYALAAKLFQETINRGCAKIYKVHNGQETFATGLFLVKYNRIINVFAASVNTKKHANSMSVLLAKIMEKHCGSNYVFDFEGSDIPGVKQYFESFGSAPENYPVKHYNHLPFWLKILRPH